CYGGALLGRSRFGEGDRELGSGADGELAVDAGEMDLNGALGDEERLGDLAVGGPPGRQFGYAPLARGERVDAAQGDAPRARAGGQELALAPSGEGCGTADRGQLDGPAKVLARLGSA